MRMPSAAARVAVNNRCCDVDGKPNSLPSILAGATGQLEKVFKAAVGFLEEGSLDARTYGKRIIWQVSTS